MATQLNNSANLTYNYDGLTGYATSNIATTQLLEQYSLTAKKSSHNTGFRPGENLTYIVEITNSGTMPLYGVTVTDNLGGVAPLLVYVTDSVRENRDGVIAPVTPTSLSPLVIELPAPLLAGKTTSISYVSRVIDNISAEVTEITNTAGVTARTAETGGTVITADPAPTATVALADFASLRVTKSADKATVSVGDSLTYTLSIENSGNTDALSVVVEDVLPKGFEIDIITARTGAQLQEFAPNDYTVDLNNRLTLPTGGAKTISVPAKTSAGDGLTTVAITGTIR